MHRAWHIAEVLDAFLRPLYDDGCWTDLACFARVNSIFHWHACYYVWRSADYQALNHLYEIVSQSADPFTERTSAVVAARVKRFRSYAKFVQTLYLNGKDRPTDGPDFLHSLMTSSVTTTKIWSAPPPLPELRALDIESATRYVLETAVRCLSPTLEELSIELANVAVELQNEWKIQIEEFFIVLQDLPALIALRVGELPTAFDSGMAFGELISSFHKLVTFECHGDALTQAAFRALSELLSLRTLAVGSAGCGRKTAADFNTLSPLCSDGAFPSLRSLVLREIELYTAVVLMYSVNVQLEELVMEAFIEEDFSDPLSAAIDAICSRSDYLQRIELRFWMDQDDPSPVFQWTHVSGLLRCRAVTDFRFGIYNMQQALGVCELDFEDRHLLEIASAWPLIRKLAIGWERSEDETYPSGLVDPQSLTLAGLLPLVVQCPKLHFLRLQDISAPAADAAFPGPLPSSTQEVEFCLDHLHTANIPADAVLLSTLWPNITLSKGNMPGTGDTWMQLNDALASLRPQSKTEAATKVGDNQGGG